MTNPIQYLTSILLLTLSFISNVSAQGDLIVTDIDTISGTETYDNVIVESGGILIIDSTLNVNFNMTVKDGGNVTHFPRQLSGLSLNVTGTLDVQMGGVISVAGSGLKGGTGGGSAFGSHGETFNTDGQIVAGSNNGAGGSYGGSGGHYPNGNGIPSATYGLIEDPKWLGSGGATCCGGFNPRGGDGGGRVNITASNLTVNGNIYAYGTNGTADHSRVGGGGSGGSIKIQAGSIEGDGLINANGGRGWCFFCPGDAKASGGGGRIAIYYDSMVFPVDHIYARTHGTIPGVPEHIGGAGTIYLKNSTEEGQLIIDNGSASHFTPTRLETNLTSFKSLIITGNSNFNIRPGLHSEATISDSIIVSTNCTVKIDSGFTLTIPNTDGFDIRCYSGGKVTLDSGSVVNANAFLIEGGALETWTDLSFPNADDLLLSDNGQILVRGNTNFSLAKFDTANIKSGLFSLSENSQLNLPTDEIIIGAGVLFEKDGKLGAADQVNEIEILPSGLITHSIRLLSGLNLNANNINVHLDGSINVTSRGLRGGRNSGNQSQSGETFDPDGNIIAGSPDACCAASYGGSAPGGSANAPYGLIEDPTWLGSGGGSGGASYAGNGGGRVTINCTGLTVNGSIIASGQNGQDFNSSLAGGMSTGGSGGSIKITTNSITGDGTIESKGGNGVKGTFGNVPGAGGGRIAIFYGSSSFPKDHYFAQGGTPSGVNGLSTYIGSAGTIYLESDPTQRELIIHNADIESILATPLLTDHTQMKSITVRNKGSFDYSKEIELTSSGGIELLSSGVINVLPEITLQIGTCDTSHIKSGTVFLQEGSFLEVNSNLIMIGDGVQFIKDGSFNREDSISNLSILSGGMLTHSERHLPGLNLNITNTLNIETGGKIDVSRRGLKGGKNGSLFGIDGETFSEDGNSVIAGSTYDIEFGGGGSYGGLGAVGSYGGDPNPIYGDLYFPDFLGSGGASNISLGLAGNGGGKIKINALNITNNGNVLADGGDGLSSAAGGSGGSILIFSESIQGSGLISAKGGYGSCDTNPNLCSGSGGGGRIAVYTLDPAFPSTNITADPIPNIANAAEPGTIIYKQCDFNGVVGLDTILFPTPSAIVPIDSSINPQVVVRNYSPNTEIVPVRFTIGNFYVDESYLNLKSGERDTITFYPWEVKQSGIHTAQCEVVISDPNCDFDRIKTAEVVINSGQGPIITSRSPSVGGASGNVTMEVKGDNYREGVTAWLEKPGGATLPAQYIEWKSDTKLFASFSLLGVDTGFYNLTVRNPDMQTGEFQNALRITPGSFGWEGVVQEDCYASDFDPGDFLDIQFEHFHVARRNVPFKVDIVYKNISNIDIPVITKRFKTDRSSLLAQQRASLPIFVWGRCGWNWCGGPLDCCDGLIACNLEVLLSSIKPGKFAIPFEQMGCPQSPAQVSINLPKKTEFILEFKEKDGPSNILRPGAGGVHTIWLYPGPELYANLQRIKFLLVD